MKKTTTMSDKELQINYKEKISSSVTEANRMHKIAIVVRKYRVETFFNFLKNTHHSGQLDREFDKLIFEYMQDVLLRKYFAQV